MNERRFTLDRWFPILLVFLAVWIGLFRLHTIDEPIERDITAYAVIAHELLEGKALYADMWDNKPPGIFLVFALGELIGGYGMKGIFLINILAALSTFAGIVLFSFRAFGKAAALMAACVYALTGGEMRLDANQCNVEAFMNPIVIWSGILLLEAGSASIVRAVCMGLLCALGLLLKQNTLFPLIAMGCTIWYIRYRNGDASGWAAFVPPAIVISMTAVAWGGTIAWFWCEGRLEPFWTAVITFNWLFTGKIRDTMVAATHMRHLIPFLLLLLPAWVLYERHHREPRSRYYIAMCIIMAGLIGTEVAVAWTNKWFPHYFQLFLPWFAVLAGALWGRVESDGEPPADAKKWFFAGIGVLLLIQHLWQFSLSPIQWSKEKFGIEFIATMHQGYELRELLKEGESFFQMEDATGLYFWSRISPPTRFIHHYPLFSQLGDRLLPFLFSDLEKSKPELIVCRKHMDPLLAMPGKDLHPLIEWVKEGYRPLPGNERRPYFSLYCRKNSRFTNTPPDAALEESTYR
ncbi:glycosyltransferase family 39 protein [Candidatus Ozemobacteraceae bacterium]|nr:glycosyltransferase family 39 protein [Candidatus Ozemobacteraceae bacterium]